MILLIFVQSFSTHTHIIKLIKSIGHWLFKWMSRLSKIIQPKISTHLLSHSPSILLLLYQYHFFFLTLSSLLFYFAFFLFFLFLFFNSFLLLIMLSRLLRKSLLSLTSTPLFTLSLFSLISLLLFSHSRLSLSISFVCWLFRSFRFPKFLFQFFFFIYASH